jgi:hypothetical protein
MLVARGGRSRAGSVSSYWPIRDVVWLMMLNVDHFTPLSRAVASIDRDSYAARFAVYDREHKALLRRLATAEVPCSDADIAREERAFRDAIRRIEFADEDDRPTLVPPDEPVAEAPPEARREPAWPQPPLPRRETPVETPGAPNLPGPDQLEPRIALEPSIQLSEPRSVARRVGARLAIAAVALALAGTWLWMGEGPRKATEPSSGRETAAPAEPAPSSNTTDAKAQQPTWLSPEILYSPSIMPSPSPAPPPRGAARLPVPRPER